MRDTSGSLIFRGEARQTLDRMPAAAVQCIVTSPPYYQQRDYGNGAGEIGAEVTPEAYLTAVADVMASARRVLRDDGVLWLNIGDKVSDGEMLTLPWRLASIMRADGWWLRQDVIWAKPSPMPGAAGGRCTSAHEYVLLFSKSKKYFFDPVAIEEPAAHGGTKNRRSVWTIASTPYKGAHFATMPITLAELCIKAGTSEKGCCPHCRAPLTRIVERRPIRRERPNDFVKRRGEPGTGNSCPNSVAGVEKTTTGWQRSCSDCPAGEPIPCGVLDPFGGSGTTAVAATRLGRWAAIIEMNDGYADLAAERIRMEGGQT